MILIVGVAPIIRCREVDAQIIGYCKQKTGIEYKECGMSLVTLSIEIQRIDSGKILSLISLPSEDTIVVSIKGQSAILAKLDDGVNLSTISATKVVITVDDIVIVGQTSAKQNSINENTLL